MTKTIAAIFGIFTVLATLGTMTPTGQAMLGLRPQQQAEPVTTIKDTPASPPAPVQQVRRVVPSSHPNPASREEAPPAPARPTQAQGGGGLSTITNILLNLPQVLDQTHIGPATGGGSWSEPGQGDQPRRRVKKQGDDQGDGTH
ncbi:MAG TPA: hypothetical protein VJT32_05940 [bacterium]|nr:hypothetical protein [bacterium]